MIPTVANFRKNGVTQVKCPRCRTAQPLYQEGDHIEEVGFGGPYSVNHDGVVHPDFVNVRNVVVVPDRVVVRVGMRTGSLLRRQFSEGILRTVEFRRVQNHDVLRQRFEGTETLIAGDPGTIGTGETAGPNEAADSRGICAPGHDIEGVRVIC